MKNFRLFDKMKNFSLERQRFDNKKPQAREKWGEKFVIKISQHKRNSLGSEFAGKYEF